MRTFIERGINLPLIHHTDPHTHSDSSRSCSCVRGTD